MTDNELISNLTSYKIQLEQVEAALSADPKNEDLNKLREDLVSVIQLTLDLIEKQQDNVHAVETNTNHEIYDWKVGDKCLAIWSKNGNYYEAIIDEIIDDKHATITFAKYGTKDVSLLNTLKPYSEELDTNLIKNRESTLEASKTASIHPLNPNSISTKDKTKSKKEFIKTQYENRKKKAQKKAERLQKLDAEGEREKNKWKEFNFKAAHKGKKGVTKKSIFATPDTELGKVGVGTCGVAGKPMSKQMQALNAKHNRYEYR